MNINIGNKISTLRANQGYTQEQLAKLCGVSSAAVSKWENNQSLPDITILPIIARIFHISIDELFNFELELDATQIDQMIQELILNFKDNFFDEAMSYCKNLVRTYPNSDLLKLKIAGSSVSVSMCLYQKENAQELINTFHAFAKEQCLSLTSSNDLQIRQSACILMSTFYAMDEPQKALDLLQTIPKLSNTTSIECSLYRQLNQNDKAIHLLHTQLYSDCSQIYMNIFSLISLYLEQKEEHKAKELLSIMESLQQILPTGSSFYTQCYLFYAKLKDKENTLRLLKEYVQSLRGFKDILFTNENILKNHPCFSTVALKENPSRTEFTEEIIEKLLSEDTSLDFLREDPQYQAILHPHT